MNTFKLIITSFFFVAIPVLAAPILSPQLGGTGVSTPPADGYILVGSGGKYVPRDASTLGLILDPAYANASSTILRYGTSTNALTEGSANLFWTNARFDTRLAASTSYPQAASIGSSTGQTTILGKTILTNASTTNLSVSGFSVLTGTTSAGILTATNLALGKTRDTTTVLDIKTLNASVNKGLRIENDNANNLPFGTYITGDANLRYTFGPNGSMNWGNGTQNTDTNLYRSATGTLATDGAIMATEETVATSTSIAVSWASSTQQLIKLGLSATTITFTNYASGQTLRLVVCQSPNGTTTVAWPAIVQWPGATAPTLTPTAKKCDILTFLATNGSSTLSIFGGYALNY